MAKPSSYQAAQLQKDQDWFTAYRAKLAERGGRSYINDRPVEEVLGPRPAPRATAAAPAAPPNVLGWERDKAMQEAERVGQLRYEQQSAMGNDQQNRYNAFLEEQGINPNTIGGARIVDRVSDMGANPTVSREMLNPSLAQQQTAQDAADMANTLEGRDRIAARRAFQRGDGQGWANIMGGISQDNAARGGGRDASRNRAYWLDRVLQSAPNRRQTWGMASNGY